MNEILPRPPKRERFEYRSSSCRLHANRCAERRPRGSSGSFSCVFCVNAATAEALLAPANPAAQCPPLCPGCLLLASLPPQEPASPPQVTAVTSPAAPPRADEDTPPSQPTQAGDDAGASPCRCWHANIGGGRLANRWCDVHAAEWHVEHGAIDVGHADCAVCARSRREDDATQEPAC